MIYVNNAAGSFPKPQNVKKAGLKMMEQPFIDTGRSAFSSLDRISQARKNIASFLGITYPQQCIFTSGATESLNMAILGLDYSEKNEVVTTAVEHNSALRPLHHLQREGKIKIKIVPCDEKGNITSQEITSTFTENTRVCLISHASNVTGAVLDIAGIIKESRKRGIVSIIDCSQSAGSLQIEVEELGADLMAFAGHKGLFGLPGIGLLHVRKGFPLKALKSGGTGIRSAELYQPKEYPLYLEAGTKNYPGIICLDEGIKHICELGLDKIQQKKQELLGFLFQQIQKIRRIKIYSECQNNNPGILAFNMAGLSPDELGRILETSFGIISRSGLHCAPLIHSYLGCAPSGCLRISLSHFNTMKEMDEIANALRKLCR